MGTYRVTVRTNPYFNNQYIDQKITLTPEQLYGIVVLSEALFSDGKDQYIQVQDPTLRTFNLDNLIQQADAVIFDGEAAADLRPTSGETWLDSIYREGYNAGVPVNITKRYTAKLEGVIDLIIQFDSLEFLQGMHTLLEWLGLDPVSYDYIKFIHDYNQPMEAI